LSWIDIVIAAIILSGAYSGYKEGFLMEVFSLLALVLGVIGGFMLLGNAMVMIGQNVEVHESILPFVAFAVVFVIIVIVVSLLGKMIKASLTLSFLGNIDQAMGGVLGLVKSAFLLSVAIWITNYVAADWLAGFGEESLLFRPIAGFAPAVTELLGHWFPAVRDLFS
jgi:membrane protein required for colicin V production